MWSSTIEDLKSNSTSTSSGTSLDDKRSFNCSSSRTSKPCATLDLPNKCNENRLRSYEACGVSEKTTKTRGEVFQDKIIEWQLSSLTNCVYDNAINVELDSLRVALHVDHSISSSDFLLENEAVLMAIESKGLKHQDSDQDDDLSDSSDSSLIANKIDYFYNSGDSEDCYRCTPEFSEQAMNSDKNQESSFENNFISTAVSAAIERKGLSKYHV